MGKKVKVIIVICFLLIVLSCGGFFTYKYLKYKEKMLAEETIKVHLLIQAVSGNYSTYVKTNKEANLYCLENKEYKKCGTLGEDVTLKLKDITINENTLYFPIETLEKEYYLYYEDSTPSVEPTEYEKRFKRYIPFDKNIKTKESTSLYKDDKLIYTLPEEVDLPIYIMDGDKYYVIYNDEFYYILKGDNTEVYNHENSNEKIAGSISTIAYHFIYNPGKDNCNEIICHKYSDVQSQFTYLKENNYFAINLEEFELWIDKKLNLPAKSIVLTIDDGVFGWNAKKIFSDNKLTGNMFMVTSWFDPHDYEGEYFRMYSHTHNLHTNWVCPKSGYAGSQSQGGAILCKNDSEVMADLKLSRERTYNRTAIAYPFYDYSDNTISQLKRAGFTMGFGGKCAGGHCNMERGGDKFKIPRYTMVSSSTNVATLKNILASNYSV